MKINFTKKQYAKLIRTAYIAEWVINSYNLHKDRNKDYDDLLEYILSFAKDYGMKEMVDISGGKIYPSRLLDEDEETRSFLDKYSEENFWDELIDRLALRDFNKHYSKEEIQKMDFLERESKIDPFREKYAKEFKKNGLGRIQINND